MSRPSQLLLLGLIAAAPLSAQTRVHVFGGGVISNLYTADGTQIPNETSRNGFLAGAGATISLSKHLSIGPEVMYIQKGAKASDNSHNIEEAIKLDYLEVPLLLRLDFGNGAVHPFVTGGGAYAVKLKCQLHFTGLGQSLIEACSADNNEVTSSDFSALVGGGVALGRFSLSVRYDFGLQNISEGSSGNAAVKNRVGMGVLSIRL